MSASNEAIRLEGRAGLRKASNLVYIPSLLWEHQLGRRQPKAFWAILLAAAVVLLLLIARLVLRADPPRSA